MASWSVAEGFAAAADLAALGESRGSSRRAVVGTPKEAAGTAAPVRGTSREQTSARLATAVERRGRERRRDSCGGVFDSTAQAALRPQKQEA